MVTRLVLVHSPLVGPAAWELVAPALAGPGYEVVVPDLTGTVAAGPPYCSRQAEVIARSASGQPTVLIGHSGAGPLLAHAAGILEDVPRYIFVDAGLPISGQSWMETVPAELAARVREMADADGWLPPWPDWWGADGLTEILSDPDMREHFAADCPRLPLAMFEEVHPEALRWREASAGYLRLSEAYDEPAAEARGFGWPVIERESDHLALLTDPALIISSLQELLRQLHR